MLHYGNSLGLGLTGTHVLHSKFNSGCADILNAVIIKRNIIILFVLQGFKENIAKSKANATEALKLIPLIKQLIKEANETGQDADDKVSSAEGDATMSFETASKANATTAQAKDVRIFVYLCI